MNPENIRQFGWMVQRVIDGNHLSRIEAKLLFGQVLSNQQPELQQGAFLAALSAKGETTDELVGAWEAIVELDTVAARGLGDGLLVENSGTGMDQLKTFNVSTAAAILAAAAGVRMARHGSRGLTSSCGTVDVLEAAGLDVDCSVDEVAKSIRTAGIGLFNGMSAAVHPGALGRILSQIRFGSTLNVAASLASPCRPTHGLRGVHRASAVDPVAHVMRAIGYRRALVVFGWDGQKTKGMDELSTLGETEIAELRETGEIKRFTVTPDSLGIRKADSSEVAATGSAAREAELLVRVLAGKGSQAREDLVCLNAGAILYLVGLAVGITSGIAQARELLGVRALDCMRRWIRAQARSPERGEWGLQRFERIVHDTIC